MRAGKQFRVTVFTNKQVTLWLLELSTQRDFAKYHRAWRRPRRFSLLKVLASAFTIKKNLLRHHAKCRELAKWALSRHWGISRSPIVDSSTDCCARAHIIIITINNIPVAVLTHHQDQFPFPLPPAHQWHSAADLHRSILQTHVLWYEIYAIHFQPQPRLYFVSWLGELPAKSSCIYLTV